MESKFPIESDLGKYFTYELYLRSMANSEEKDNQLHNAEQFQQCLNLNRVSLRSLNCGERKKKLDSFIESNSDNFSEFKEKISQDCHPQISNYLSSRFVHESSSLENSLYQRLNSEVMLENNLADVLKCLNN